MGDHGIFGGHGPNQKAQKIFKAALVSPSLGSLCSRVDSLRHRRPIKRGQDNQRGREWVGSGSCMGDQLSVAPVRVGLVMAAGGWREGVRLCHGTLGGWA